MRPRVFRAMVGSLVEALTARDGDAVGRVLAPLDGPSQRTVYDAAVADLAARAAAAARHPAVAGRPPQCRRVRSVRVYAVSPTVVEACAVVSGAVRSRAVALRLEVVGDRWVATAVQVG